MITNPELWQEYVPLDPKIIVDTCLGGGPTDWAWFLDKRAEYPVGFFIDACRRSVEALGYGFSLYTTEDGHIARVYSMPWPNGYTIYKHRAWRSRGGETAKRACIAAVDWLANHRKEEAEKKVTIYMVTCKECQQRAVGTDPSQIVHHAHCKTRAEAKPDSEPEMTVTVMEESNLLGSSYYIVQSYHYLKPKDKFKLVRKEEE
jgi:hypothetical protein